MKRRYPGKSSSRASLGPIAKHARSFSDAAAGIDLAKIRWTPHLCPNCGKNLNRQRRRSDGRPFLACPDRDCGHTEKNRA